MTTPPPVLRAAVVRALRVDAEGRYVFRPTPAIDGALETALAGERARPEIYAILALGVALETTLGSPSAAQALRAWLRRSRPALGVIRAIGRARARGLAPRERPRPLQTTPPPGSVPLRTLLDPVTRNPRRAAMGRE